MAYQRFPHVIVAGLLAAFHKIAITVPIHGDTHVLQERFGGMRTSFPYVATQKRRSCMYRFRGGSTRCE